MKVTSGSGMPVHCVQGRPSIKIGGQAVTEGAAMSQRRKAKARGNGTASGTRCALACFPVLTDWANFWRAYGADGCVAGWFEVCSSEDRPFAGSG
jgi:hypothetical protein